MNFFSHKIANPAGNGPTWDEWVNNLLQKMAREAKPDGQDDPRCSCRGQVINNDNDEGAGQSYQDGESVKGKKEDGDEGKARKEKGWKTDQKKAESAETVKEAKCGKEMGESSDAGKVTEKHTEAAPGDDENKDCKQLINNDPNYQKGESTDPGKVKGKNKKQPGDPVVGKGKKKSEGIAQFKKIASLNRQEKIALIVALTKNKNNPIEYVEAMVGLKIANLAEEEKAFLRKFWETMYDSDYVEAMLADR